MGLELGQKVYLIYGYSITVDTVYAIGKDTFIRNGFDDSTILPVAWFFLMTMRKDGLRILRKLRSISSIDLNMMLHMILLRL